MKESKEGALVLREGWREGGRRMGLLVGWVVVNGGQPISTVLSQRQSRLGNHATASLNYLFPLNKGNPPHAIPRAMVVYLCDCVGNYEEFCTV